MRAKDVKKFYSPVKCRKMLNFTEIKEIQVKTAI